MLQITYFDRDPVGGRTFIDIDTYNELVKILHERPKKSHLKMTFMSSSYAANIPENLATKHKDSLTLEIDSGETFAAEEKSLVPWVWLQSACCFCYFIHHSHHRCHQHQFDLNYGYDYALIFLCFLAACYYISRYSRYWDIRLQFLGNSKFNFKQQTTISLSKAL